MAPKRLPHVPPPASSSEDEEVEEEEDQNHAIQEEDKSGEEDEEEDQQMNENEDGDGNEEDLESPEKKPKNSDSQDESGSETDTDSDRTPQSPSASDFTIKPFNPKKKISDRQKSASISAMVTPASKRAVESDLKAKESKKRKVSNVGDDEDSKKASGFQRLWSEDDEIAILKGMTDYQYNPYGDMAAFHEFIKENLHVDVSKNQLMDKIRRLKKKYQNNAEKAENGQDPVFSKPHDYKSFLLSKKIWGSSLNNDGTKDDAKSSKKKPKQSGKANNSLTVQALPKPDVVPKKEVVTIVNNGEVKAERDDFWFKFPCLKESLQLMNSSLGLERLMSSVKEVMPLIGSSKAKELDNRWEKLQIEEMELYVQKSGLLQEQGKLILDSLKAFSKP